MLVRLGRAIAPRLAWGPAVAGRPTAKGQYAGSSAPSWSLREYWCEMSFAMSPLEALGAPKTLTRREEEEE